MNQGLVLETKLYNLSTNSKGCTILNQNKNYQSLCQYYIPNMIHIDESIEYIFFCPLCCDSSIILHYK